MENKTEEKMSCGWCGLFSHSKYCMLKIVLILLVVFVLGVVVGKHMAHHKSHHHKHGWHDKYHKGGYMMKDKYRRERRMRDAYYYDEAAFRTNPGVSANAAEGVSSLSTQ